VGSRFGWAAAALLSVKGWESGWLSSAAGSGGRLGFGGGLLPGAALAERTHLELDQGLVPGTQNSLEQLAGLHRRELSLLLDSAHPLGDLLLSRLQRRPLG